MIPYLADASGRQLAFNDDHEDKVQLTLTAPATLRDELYDLILDGGAPLKIPAGGTARLRVAVQTGRFPDNKVDVELSDPPEGITIRKSSTGIHRVFMKPLNRRARR